LSEVRSLHIVREWVNDDPEPGLVPPEGAADRRVSPDHPSVDWEGAIHPSGARGPASSDEEITDEGSTTRTITIAIPGPRITAPPRTERAARPSPYECGLAAAARHEVHIERVWPMRSPPTGSLEGSSSANFQSERRGTPPARVVPVGGLRMSQAFPHEPVMADEVVELLRPVPPGLVVDATVGGGGHAAALLRGVEGISLLGLDRDPVAVAAATEALRPFGARAVVLRSRFDALAEVVSEFQDAGPLAPSGLSGVLFDLGVSSPQLDVAERGFSYRRDAPLDMRMDPTSGRSAADLVNELDEDELVELLTDNGEGRFARRIARAIIAARPLVTTGQLADVVRTAIPAATRRTGGHPARRAFQAIRIAVNEELGQLQTALDDALTLLQPGGRCVAIAYHSGEDRLVKTTFVRAATGDCRCPPGLPCACGADPQFRLVRRGARRPSAEEIGRNHRAEAARLRVIERLPSSSDRPSASGRVA
jgi:16S rRNA (cytosine1402-N4)-methyltransferase